MIIWLIYMVLFWIVNMVLGLLEHCTLKMQPFTVSNCQYLVFFFTSLTCLKTLFLMSMDSDNFSSLHILEHMLASCISKFFM